MITKDEWDQAFDRLVPLLGAGIGVLSLALGIVALTRSPLGHRVYYQDGQYLVSVRYPGQWHELRDFVQPSNPDVVAIYSQIGPDVWGCLDFVCRDISYRRDIGEFWQTPSETLKGYGDCEDSSILLTSLLKNFTDAHVALGGFQGLGHAWVVSEEGKILEATYSSARPVPDPEDYQAMVMFNNMNVLELYPGALQEVFELGRDEELKVNLMAEAVNGLATCGYNS